MKILVDMNLSPRWVGYLRSEGLAADHWSTIGRSDAPDSKLMEWAAQSHAVILTHDLDFGAILASTGDSRPSVIQVRAGDLSPEVIGGQVISTLRQLSAELERGALITLDSERTRVRLLPFGSSQ